MSPRRRRARAVLPPARQEHLSGRGLRLSLVLAASPARPCHRHLGWRHDPRPSIGARSAAQVSAAALEPLPAYAPQLNPIVAAWHAAKHPLANGRPGDIHTLAHALLSSLRNVRDSQRALRGCVTQSELPPFFSRYCIVYETVNKGKRSAGAAAARGAGASAGLRVPGLRRAAQAAGEDIAKCSSTCRRASR